MTHFEPEKVLAALEMLAHQHSPSSMEYASIELAAKALLFIHASGQSAAFNKYLQEFHGELSEEQRQFIDNLGLSSGD